MKRLSIVLALAAFSASAETFQMTQAGAGAGTGVDVANAISVSFFNTAGNWGAGAGKISPGDTVVINNTLTAQLVIQTSGTAGNPITVQFASGAKMSKAHWNLSGSASPSDAAIYANGKSYITIDGQTYGANLPQGIIEATANGTGLANSVFNHGVYFDGTCQNVIIKNLQISNLFVRTSMSASISEDGIRGIRIFDSAGNNLITNNVIWNVCHGIAVNHVGSPSGDEIAYNIVKKRDAGILYTSSSTGISTNVLIHDNAIGDAVQWDDGSDNFHHDGLHLYSGGATGHPDGLRYYNNYHYGDRGIHSTADVFLEDYWQHIYVYNNIFSNSVTTSGHTPSNGHITMKGRGIAQNSTAANNTLVLIGAGGHALYLDSSTGNSIVNNIVEGDATATTTGTLLASAGDTSNTIDYNIYHNVQQWFYNNSIISTYSTWKTTISGDTHSPTGNPNLASNGALQSSSTVAIDAGMTVPQVTVDYFGVSRPQGSAPDIGFSEYSSGGGGGGGTSYTTQPGRRVRKGRL